MNVRQRKMGTEELDRGGVRREKRGRSHTQIVLGQSEDEL